ncbi:Centromere protein Cenp-I [Penicillium riverlandense]|uniref:Centromere protein Cenp-I n=1 Tax=Penicillium riverlandense TaxID=1903569 RepID=UPI0025493E9D|nr:Centromere protein Cenp-I [Penicillium riverlandense]KAJ5825814.1 Centromere protein Cenp-I [Penicillium riverlandense]
MENPGNTRLSVRLLDAVEHLEAVAFLPVKQRYTDASDLAKTIASDAYENGIPPTTLARLLKILTTKNSLDQGTVTTLVKNLYPQEKIASKLITQVVCCLGPSKNKPSAATQALLLRWLILAYDLLEDRAHLAKLYAVLFNHLDMISLRKPLCHLLSLITRRKHVKPFRIQALMELLRAGGSEEKELVSLLRIFKNYYPEIIVGDLGLTRRMGLIFKHPDPEWSSHAKNLHDQNAERAAQAGNDRLFQVVHRGTVKRSKIEVVIPTLQTSRVPPKHTSLEEIRDIGHFVEKIDRIELPNQIISTLGDAIAQKYLFLVQPEAAHRRLDEWLRSFLEDKLEQLREDVDDEPETLSYVLDFVVGYASYTKELPVSVRSFLKSYLTIWNGKDNREHILRLLEYLPVESFESLQEELLSPTEAAVLDGTLASRTALLDFYSALISQWGVKLQLQPSVSEESVPLSRLIVHAGLLASSMLEFLPAVADGNQTKPGTLSVLQFYKVLAELFSYASENAHIRLTIPLSPTVYTLAFTSSASFLSMLNSILAGYKSAFETSLSSKFLQPPNPPDPLYPNELVGQFNGYVMDMCNLVWRNRALNKDDPNALGCLIPAKSIAALTEYLRVSNEASRRYDRESAFQSTVTSIFSISYHAALCNFSAACFADIENDQNIGDDRPRLRKPVTQKFLQALEKDGGAKVTWQEYRVQMLDWLEAVGCRGTSELMRSTMKALRKE